MPFKYSFDDEEALFNKRSDAPTIKAYSKAKPDGELQLTGYLNTRVYLKDKEAELAQMDVDDPRYKQLERDLNAGWNALSKTEKFLADPPTMLQRYLMASGKVTTDPRAKAIDILKDYLLAPKEGEEVQEKSSKPSLWEIFWK